MAPPSAQDCVRNGGNPATGSPGDSRCESRAHRLCYIKHCIIRTNPSNSQPEIEELEHRAVLGHFAQGAANAVGAACEPAGAFRVVRWHGPGATAWTSHQQRDSLKDLQDICALLRHGLSLAEGLSCARAIYGKSFNPRITLVALSYPPALEGLPAEDSQLLAQTVEAIRKVPALAVAPLGRIGEIAPGNPVLDPRQERQ